MNPLLVDMEPRKSRGCVLQHCCPACSAVSSVSMLHMMGHRESREGTGVGGHIACSRQPLHFVLHHANSPSIFKATQWTGMQGLVVLHHLLLSLSSRSSKVVHVVGACQDQLPAAMCSWKGGRYTVREWVAGLTVNRSLFLLCLATPDDTRVRGM